MAREALPGIHRVSRFETGLRHFVFEATGTDGRSVVVRASRRSDETIVRDSIYWSDLLRPLGVPLPAILHSDLTLARHPFPFVILERLPGRDLGFVVGELSHAQLRDLAERLCATQASVTSLAQNRDQTQNPDRGYGFAPRLDGPFPHKNWGETIAQSLAGSRRRIRQAKIVDERHADRVHAASQQLDRYFEKVAPTPFLHDITTKNVILDGGRLTGIVDVDDLCFGDPMFLLGLTRTALLSRGHATPYIDFWLEILSPEPEEIAALDFYTALFCLNFLSEIGHRFNRTEPIRANAAYIETLLSHMDRHLKFR